MKFKTTQLVLMFCILSSCGQVVVFAQSQIDVKDEIAKVNRDTVFIRDVVSVVTPETVPQGALGLDLDQFSEVSRQLSVSQEQIQYRLLLAGYSDIEVGGAAKILVNRVERIQSRVLVEQRIHSRVAAQYSIPESALHVALDAEFQLRDKSNLNLDSFRVEALNVPELPLGRTKITAWIEDAAGEAKRLSIPVELGIYRQLAVAQMDIQRGTVLTEEHIQAVRRPVTSQQQNYLTIAHALGKQATTDIDVYSLVKRSSVGQNNTKEEVTIPRNQVVDAVLQRGGLSVTLKGVKAMTDGRKGEFIQIKNMNNGELMMARVIDANTVQLR